MVFLAADPTWGWGGGSDASAIRIWLQIFQSNSIRRTALGENPALEEMRVVVEYGLEQHRINLQNLYLRLTAAEEYFKFI